MQSPLHTRTKLRIIHNLGFCIQTSYQTGIKPINTPISLPNTHQSSCLATDPVQLLSGRPNTCTAKRSSARHTTNKLSPSLPANKCVSRDTSLFLPISSPNAITPSLIVGRSCSEPDHELCILYSLISLVMQLELSLLGCHGRPEALQLYRVCNTGCLSSTDPSCRTNREYTYDLSFGRLEIQYAVRRLS